MKKLIEQRDELRVKLVLEGLSNAEMNLLAKLSSKDQLDNINAV